VCLGHSGLRDARLALFPADAHAFQLFWSFLPEAADAIARAWSFIHSGDALHRPGISASGGTRIQEKVIRLPAGKSGRMWYV
jgi:hypothetical protein